MSAGASGLTASVPVLVFDDPRFVSMTDGYAYYDAAPDGRFIMVERLPGAAAPRELVVVTDWVSELKRRLAAR